MNAVRIRIAEEKDIPALKRIWSDCFGDEESYIDFFFARRFAACRAVCAERSGKVVGAAYLLPARIRDGAEVRPAWYGYAVGVDPQYRRRGICEAMFRWIYADAEKEDAVFFLSPASPALAQYYERIGMFPTHYAKIEMIAAVDHHKEVDIILVPAELHHYSRFRRCWEIREGAIAWLEDALRYAIDENKITKGICQTTPDQQAFAAGRMEKCTLKLTELYCPEELRDAFLTALAAKTGAGQICLRSCTDAQDPDGFVLGMTYNMRHPASGSMGPLLD